MAYFDGQFGSVEALANLGLFFPQFVVKSLSEGEYGIFLNTFFMVNPNHVSHPSTQENLRSKLRMTRRHKNKIQLNPTILHHLFQLIPIQILRLTIVIFENQGIAFFVNFVDFFISV